ncbi:hypothetical protein HPP92_001044 [Vanilla planifolia]|uniref:Cytochrome P450 n=1 Tax=Vanilla planifolia TaxID=51239 RepID=A0A835SC96_VANPL|nr:hypothetical protein HPP92_001044 [Vanilla planifolia]
MGYFGLIWGSLVLAIVTSLWSQLVAHAWRPYWAARRLRKQGVKGPKGNFWSGNEEEIKQMKMERREMILDIKSHDFLEKVQPDLAKWGSQYGGIFMFWSGKKPKLHISDPELAKQVLSNKFGFYRKIDVGPGIMALLGKGLVLAEGADWVRHRRVVSPAFTMDKLKTMTGTIADCAEAMLTNWNEKKEVEVSLEFQELTANAISHSVWKQLCFRKGSFSGTERASNDHYYLFLQKTISFQQVTKVSPLMDDTKANRSRRRLERKMRDTLMDIIERRLESKEAAYGEDLLGLMMQACMSGNTMTMDEIISECKTFFFAGHETTSHLLTWTIFLLSTHQEWQQRLREEVLRECGKETPDADKIGKLKLMTMVLFEVLRLYSPVMVLGRTAIKDVKLGSLVVPKDMDIIIPVAGIHHSKETWGADANEFNPLRFENGVTKAANHPNAMLAFSTGPRACVGQSFAMLEAKIVLSMILQKFSFVLSPDYKHMPADMLTLQPQRGLPILLQNLSARELL